ncbi:uncharacterized protein LOC119989606 [Tripterygium wilfordii]|uniref:uncharacterized protein LOC119989606 n=1 Tax=Tripterygium wilfordii TaxID=458696 RepID=UPI0018F8644F|nr:uncharacterized protein LOC119989606 [Tripterygium wilfordii]
MTKPKTIYLHPQPPFTSTKQDVYKSNTLATRVSHDMTAENPVEIGTIGSLMMQEIEYFSRLESHSRNSVQRSQSDVGDMDSSSKQSRTTFGSVMTAQKKKKRESSWFIPTMCSMVEVSDNNRKTGISGFNYKNLNSDMKKLKV